MLDAEIASFDKACLDDGIFTEYLSFSIFFQKLFIRKDSKIKTDSLGYCNSLMIHQIHSNINRHPLLWKLVMYIFGCKEKL